MKNISVTSFRSLLAIFLFLGIFISFMSNYHATFAHPAYADSLTPTSTSVPASTPTTPTPGVSASTTATTGDWVPDTEVTFLGKAASRSASFMNWTLLNYKWGYMDDSIAKSWTAIRNIVYILLLLVVLIAAAVMIVTGGRNVGVYIFIKKFILLILLITFSFALIRFLYQIADIIQGFFIHNPDGSIISSKDLLNMSFGYQNFVGFRLIGAEFQESAFISLLLIKLTAITYYVMANILLVRKIILWMLLVVSPLYPLVLLYFPVKSTAKIWLSEFFRWLLYAPLFTIFLSAVVVIWRSSILVLPFNFQNATPSVYPTAISILLGGPGQKLSLSNSLNYNDTFAQYIVALIMLWIVILLPFVLLQILLDFIAHYPFDKINTPSYIKDLRSNISNGFSFMKNPTPPAPSPLGQEPTGVARALPFQQIRNTINEKIHEAAGVSNTHQSVSTSSVSQHLNTINQNQQTTTASSNMSTTQQFQRRMEPTLHLKTEMLEKPALRLVSFPIPSMRDIVRFETARLSQKQSHTDELVGVQESLKKIANPQSSVSLVEKQQYTTLRQKLSQETTKGDPLAKSILSAATLVGSPTTQTPSQQVPIVTLPVTNQVQTVSLDDYEAVKDLWVENYKNIDVPVAHASRHAWIEDDINKISQTITLITATDPQQVQKGLANVSTILPFLLIGGFSTTEVIAYLKAKLEAGKAVVKQFTKEEENQDTLLENTKKQENTKEMTTEAAASEEEKSY